jgi:hypothetical protein
MSDFGKTKFKAEHRRIREMLSLYIDGELSSGDRARVEEHLAECDDCTWELETLRQTVDLMGQLPKVPVPRAFTIYEAPRPRPFSLFQARWVCTYLKGATALAAALLILVLAADALFQFQRMTASFAPAKEFAAPAAAPTVVARQEAPPAPMEAPGLAEEVLGEAEVTPSPSAVETKALVPMPMPTLIAPAARDDGLAARAGAAATPLATPVPRVDKAEATGTPLPAAAMEAPAAEEGALETPAAPAAAPTATPQPQRTATPIPAAPLVSASAVPSATPTPMAVATATATAASVPTATPVSMARAPAGVRPTEEKGALAGPPARPGPPRLTLLRVVEASLCLLVMVLSAATLMVRRRSEP